MIDGFASLEAGLSTNHWLAAAALLLATFILEDAATITAGVLAVGGVIPAPIALGAVYLGIIAGDTGLYGIGRAAIKTGWAQRFITPRSLSQGRRWLRRRLIPALIGARFTPGMRMPTFVASGFLRISFWRFFAVTGLYLPERCRTSRSFSAHADDSLLARRNRHGEHFGIPDRANAAAGSHH